MSELEVHSYRAVFELERRIYRVDTVRLSPSGIPLRGLAYGLVLSALLLLLAHAPLLGATLSLLPWYVLYAGVPAALAACLTIVRVEGRAFHVAIWSLILHRLGPRHVSGWRRAPRPGSRWSPPPVTLLPDGSDPTLRRMRYRGPGAVLVGVSHDRIEHRSVLAGRMRLTLRGRADERPLRRGVGIVLAPGARLDCMPWR